MVYRTLLLIALALIMPSWVYAASSASNNAPSGPPAARYIPWNPLLVNVDSEDKAWFNEDWTGDDSEYIAAVASIDKLNTLHLLNGSAIENYQQGWSADKTNSLALFKWVYAANLYYRAQAVAAAYSFHNEDIPAQYGEITVAFQSFPLTHSFEFDREHFIFDVAMGALGDEYISEAERLYKRDKTNPRVDNALAFMLASSSDKSDIVMAANVADQLLAVEPSNPLSHLTWGWCHYVLWGWNKHNTADLKKAVQGYQEYFDMAKPTDGAARWFGTLLKKMKIQLRTANEHS